MNKKIVVPVALVAAFIVAWLVRSQLRPAALLPPADTLGHVAPGLEQGQTPSVSDSVRTPAAAPTATDSAAAPVAPAGPADVPAGTGEQNSAAATALRQAAAAYAGVKSMRANFAQTSDNPLLGKRTASAGLLAQRQPDRFLMRFTEPAGDIIVSDGEYFWLYYPSVDRQQVLRTRAAAAGGLDLQAQFIGDPTRRFEYTDHGVDDVAGRAARMVTMIPREPAGYRSLKVWIDQRDHLVRRFELTTDAGVVQRFELSNLEINPALPDALFRFAPPAGAQVIER